jgi:hypothetical protein
MKELTQTREEELTDWALFTLWPIMFISFLILAFYSAPIGLGVMIILYTAFAVYFAVVTPANQEDVWE